MRAPDHPEEAERLQAVGDTSLVGGLPDALQEAVVKLASEICGTPIGAVCLVDADRQWFSAVHGLGLRETLRGEAFCAHTILGDVPFIVRDATQDPRFSDNSLVTGAPAIRFYAGVPLKIVDHLPVGSLCVMDTKPREISPKQIESLKTLAALVATQLQPHGPKALPHAGELSSFLASIVDASSDAIISKDLNGIVRSWNGAAERIYGYLAEEMVGKSISMLIPPELSHENERILDQMARGESCGHFETVRIAKDGRRLDVSVTVSPLRDSLGRVIGSWKISRDITEQTRARAELENSRLALMDFAENASVGLQWIDRDGIIIWANKAELELLGYTPEEFFGQPVSRFHADSKAIRDILARLARRERLLGYEACLVAKDGSKKIVSIYSSVYEQGGEFKHTRCFMIDITDRTEADEGLKESRKVIERQNTALSVMAERAHRVVDDVSHEFRTPLAVIKEFASIITDGLAGPVSDKQAQYLRIISGAVVDLNHMVEDLLDSSKLRAGILRVDRRSHRVNSIFATGRAALASKASTRSIVINERIEEGLPALFADEEKVRRVISNLTTNAIKFSPEGGMIVLSAATAARTGEIIISVTDHGPGLSSSDIERLFGRFQQASTARSVAAKGFGLGLSIAQELSWLNLGKLSVTSEKGKGATFSFTLPTDDCVSVLEHYFDSIVASNRPEDQLSLLRVVAQAPTALDETQEFLASATYPTDLIMPALRDEDDGMQQEYAGQAWWILGRTRSVESWIARLCESRRSQSLENTIRLAPLSVDVCGMWRLPENALEARVDVIEAVTQEKLRDAKNPNH